MRLLRIVASAVVALTVACSATCLTIPCSAITVSVSASGTTRSISGAFVQSSPSGNLQPSCDKWPPTTCSVVGSAGTYQLTIGAPGYQSVTRSVVVPQDAGGSCNFGVKQQHLDVVLTPAP